eukprot:5240178-Pyramimonas_sp.AAC.1
MRILGFGVASADIPKLLWFDLDRPCVQKVARGWITGVFVASLWIGTACCSWSQARHGPPNSSWCRPRSPSHIWGCPILSPEPASRVRRGILNSSFVFLSSVRAVTITCLWRPRIL